MERRVETFKNQQQKGFRKSVSGFSEFESGETIRSVKEIDRFKTSVGTENRGMSTLEMDTERTCGTTGTDREGEREYDIGIKRSKVRSRCQTKEIERTEK